MKSAIEPVCRLCGCLASAHRGPGVGCEGTGGNCPCMETFAWNNKPTVAGKVRCFRRADGQTIEGCDRIRFRSHGTCEMVYRDDTFDVGLPMSLAEAELAVSRGIWIEVEDEPYHPPITTELVDDPYRILSELEWAVKSANCGPRTHNLLNDLFRVFPSVLCDARILSREVLAARRITLSNGYQWPNVTPEERTLYARSNDDTDQSGALERHNKGAP